MNEWKKFKKKTRVKGQKQENRKIEGRIEKGEKETERISGRKIDR